MLCVEQWLNNYDGCEEAILGRQLTGTEACYLTSKAGPVLLGDGLDERCGALGEGVLLEAVLVTHLLSITQQHGAVCTAAAAAAAVVTAPHGLNAAICMSVAFIHAFQHTTPGPEHRCV
jgi:hypothetical protein